MKCFETLVDRKLVHVHPQSALFNSKTAKAVVYDTLVMTTKQYMRGVLAIEPQWIAEIQPDFVRVQESVPQKFHSTSNLNGASTPKSTLTSKSTSTPNSKSNHQSFSTPKFNQSPSFKAMGAGAKPSTKF